MKAYLFCDKRSLNEATNYYVDILRRALVNVGYDWDVVHSLKGINDADIIVSITEQYFLRAKILIPKAKTIYWAQGVSAEEAKINIRDFKSWLRYAFRRFAEPIAIKKSDILFCVSDRMVQYYLETFGSFDRSKVIVMPCYNLTLESTYSKERYSNPTFVYAGNSSVWQCVDTMLEVYAYIESRLPSAKIIIFSENKDTFTSKIKNLGIKNYDIKYVSVSELQQEMMKYKYGFVLRDSHIINQVATPTKMNSYLSSGLIPIFSDGVDDFKKNINLGEFTLMAKCPLDIAEIGNMVLDFENKRYNYDKYPQIIDSVFQNHYNDEKYINILENKLTEWVKK